MIKQLLLPMAGVAAFIIIVGLMVKNPDKLSFLKNAPTPTPQSSNVVQIGNNKIEVTLANTDDKREKGLGGVKSLKENEGMLFIFKSKDVKPIFWMKDMLIDLDIIWINDGKIVQIDKNVKAPDSLTPDNKLERFSPTGKIDYVLEVNSGYSDKNNIMVGDSVITL